MEDSLDHLVVEPGAVICREGDHGHCAYIIERGRVEISVKRAGQRIVLAQRGAGEIFGEMAIIEPRPRSATVTAVEPCKFLLVTREQLMRRISGADPILRLCLTAMIERFGTTLRRLREGGQEELPSELAHEAPAPHSDDERPKPPLREAEMERELRRALSQEEFELHFQPIIELATGFIAGFEALIRWRHSEYGLVPPTVFIPTAEASGLIVPLGRWVFRKACTTVRSFREQADPRMLVGGDLFVSVNVSGRDFGDPSFVKQLDTTLEETGTDPRNVKLEITESLLMYQPDLAIASLNDCRARGFGIAIDDFGTGYSSLGYLHKIPFDMLKIDRSFIRSIREGKTSREIIRTIVDLAQQLRIPVVAEGVEDRDQALTVRDLGCGFGQGHLFSKPLPEEAVYPLLRRWKPSALCTVQPRAAPPRRAAGG